MKRTTLLLPDDLHEQLRREAFEQKISMARLIRSKLESRPASKRRTRHTDPLLEVAGLFRDGSLSKDVDETLYGS